MKLHVIGAPRCGGTAYSRYLSESKNLPFINEPFKFNHYYHKTNNGIDTLGGGISDEVEKSSSYVAHHITSQYISRWPSVPMDHNLIIMERRDKWNQLLSFCIMITLLGKYSFHNSTYQQEVITIDRSLVQRMIDEWIVLEQFKKINDGAQFLIYEDIVFGESKYKKTSGYENVTVTNLEWLRRSYDNFWRYR